MSANGSVLPAVRRFLLLSFGIAALPAAAALAGRFVDIRDLH